MKTTIIDFIKRNRVSTTQLADCMGKTGAIYNAKAVNSGLFSVGNLFWVYANNGTNWDVHKQIENVNDGDIVFIEGLNCLDKAIFGDLVAKYILLYKQASAIVTNGLVRDAPRLIKEKWPIWCNGFNPEGYSNEELGITQETQQIIAQKMDFFDDAIAVCDDTGVIVIPKTMHNQAFFDKILFIEEQEDIWFDCIDRRKYSTFETVCLKKYKSHDS